MTYTNDMFYIGFATPQLISMRVKYTSDDAISNMRRITHFYVNAGAKLALKSNNKAVEHFLIPTLFFRYAPSAPLNVNLALRYMWNYKFSAGLGYTSDGSVTVDAFVNMNKKFRIGYGFNANLNGLSTYVGTTHEIMLTYAFASTGKGWMFEQITPKNMQ